MGVFIQQVYGMLAYILNSVEWNAISQQTRTHTPTASTNLLSIYVYKQNIYERDICVHISTSITSRNTSGMY